MTDPTYDAKARAALGTAYPRWTPPPGRAGFRCAVPKLTVSATTGGGPHGFRVMIETWWEDRDGWDLMTDPASDVLHATWGEAQAALTEMLPRVDA